MELKPFASLGATLLARKGGAKPAMRPQLASIEGMGGAQAARAIADDLEDLGWNDMGQDDDLPHQAQILPLTPAPANPQAEADAFADDALARRERSANHTPAGFASSYEPHDFSEDDDEAYDLGSAPREDDEDDEEEAYDEVYDEADAYEAPEPAPVFAPVEPEVHRQQRALSASLDSGSEPVAHRPERRPEPRHVEAIDSRRAAFTLRLDARRHLKLRLASTIKNRSAQQLVTAALDKFLAEIPEIEALAAQVQRD